jgi:predicted metal-dependent phosphotriesterase family hydrolase
VDLDSRANENDPARYEDAARRGAWISLDGVSPESRRARRSDLALRRRVCSARVLVSQDAGWYWWSVSRMAASSVRSTRFTARAPRLSARGLTAAEIEMLFVQKPAEAFACGYAGLNGFAADADL